METSRDGSCVTDYFSIQYFIRVKTFIVGDSPLARI